MILFGESGKDFDNNGRIRNKKVAVYRPSDGGFHIGTITKFLENSGEHRVEYDDGKAEELYLFLMDLKWEPEIVDEKTNETEAMKEEAKEAGRLLKENNFLFDIVYTSLLKRAKRTMKICLEQMGLETIPIESSWRLNERHYGALQGLNKSETAKKFGDEQVFIWRRS